MSTASRPTWASIRSWCCTVPTATTWLKTMTQVTDAASRLEWVAPSSDTYYIEVSGFSGTLGTYQLSLSDLGAQPPDDHGDDRSGATRIRGGEFLDGDIERDGDRDLFFFSAERGREYRIKTHLGSNDDTVLFLYGPDGGYLDENDDSGDSGASRLEWVAPSSDTYYIEVSGFDGTPGTYQLSLLELGRRRSTLLGRARLWRGGSETKKTAAILNSAPSGAAST